MPNEALGKAVDVLVRSRHAVALVGAGISAESGIPTFRGPSGLWSNAQRLEAFDFGRFQQNPEDWWENILSQWGQMWSLFWQTLEAAEPSLGHYALAELETLGIIKHVLTQNVDGLHQKAGTRSLTELHGSFRNFRCVRCGTRSPIGDFIEQLAPALVFKQFPPRCSQCQSVLKPDAVFFGENLPSDTLHSFALHSALTDCLLLIGTSAFIRYVVEVAQDVKSYHGALVEINPEKTALTDICDIVIPAAAGTVLPEFVVRIRGLSA